MEVLQKAELIASADGNAEQKPVPKKKPYMRPVLMEWGMFEELTQSSGISGRNDGGKILFTKTR